MSPKTPRGHWPLGRIVDIYPGKDGHPDAQPTEPPVRGRKAKTGKGTTCSDSLNVKKKNGKKGLKKKNDLQERLEEKEGQERGVEEKRERLEQQRLEHELEMKNLELGL
ncbi:hypothetical protein P5673_020820 [Acropora cervicornis]|uniref:DUF5641 domain-containing protein n=1 Tax=Acropora cervicornis TaxID=6130 RepID=A0AAD9Q930_ACRCE|nr:hypothetical protein P5673_020820 [Acropora cervicornis]